MPYSQVLEQVGPKIAELKKSGLTGINVAASFLKRRVQPLQLRQNLGFEYAGFKDASRMSPDEISDDAVETLLAKFFRTFQGVPVVDESIREFDRWHKPREVTCYLNCPFSK